MNIHYNQTVQKAVLMVVILMYVIVKTDFIFTKCLSKQSTHVLLMIISVCFGYKTNRVKVPNITGRSKWNYVKTIDCNCDGDIPETDLNIIRTMFNNGVTMWHDASKIYDYSQTNNIVS